MLLILLHICGVVIVAGITSLFWCLHIIRFCDKVKKDIEEVHNLGYREGFDRGWIQCQKYWTPEDK